MNTKERVQALEKLILRLDSSSILEVKHLIAKRLVEFDIKYTLSDSTEKLLKNYLTTLSSYEDSSYVELTNLITKKYSELSEFDYEIF